MNLDLQMNVVIIHNLTNKGCKRPESHQIMAVIFHNFAIAIHYLLDK